jgi:hypothetical protein
MTTARASGAPSGEPPRRSRAPRLAMGLSLLTFAGVLAAAVYLPSWLAQTPQPPPAAPPGSGTGQAQLDQARSQSALVTAEDTRLLAQLYAIPWNSPAYLDRAHGAATLVLTARPAAYTLDSLLLLGAARRTDPSTVELTSSVLVAPGARLVLAAPGTTLRMTSTPAGFTSLVGWKGAITLAGAPGQPLTVTSWDPAGGGPDQQVRDGRAYIRVVGADLQSHFATLSHLGFWSGRTGGLAITGSDAGPGTGWITDTTVHAGHYGLFSADTVKLTITNSTFEGAAADGILLYRGSQGCTIETSTARGNAGSGIVADRGTSAVTLRNVAAERNGEDGIRLDGRALAERPSAAGVSLDGGRGFRLEDSSTRFNTGNGVLVWDADDTVITGTAVSSNAEGIVVRGAATRNQLIGNIVAASAGAGIAVRDGATGIVVERNTIAAADTGVQVRDARVDVLDNSVTAARIHGVSFEGAVHGSAVRNNSLAGSGPSALDLNRLALGAAVGVSNNSDEQWQVPVSLNDRVRWLFGDHPLLALWSLLLLLPIIGSVLSRRHRRRNRPPVPVSPASEGSAAPEKSALTR